MFRLAFPTSKRNFSGMTRPVWWLGDALTWQAMAPDG